MADQRTFSGIRVLDMTRVLAGPFCAYQLGLLGAEVIKIEKPGKGETIRWRTEADPSFGNAGMSLGFMTQSANKRFVTLDIDKPEGREVFLKLPLAPFRFAHDGPRADTPPRAVGADTDAVLRELGYSPGEIDGLRARGVV